MNSPEENPYRSPEVAKEPEAMLDSTGADSKLSRAAKIVLGCLAFNFIGWQILSYRHQPDILEYMIGYSMFFSAPFGFVLSFPAIRRRGFWNRVIGLLGLIWFGFYFLLAITGC